MNRAEKRRQQRLANKNVSAHSSLGQQISGIQKSLSIATQHHSAGRLTEAEKIYRQILQASPDHPDALHLLGVIAHQMGQNDSAVELITRALAGLPNNADAYYNLGLAFSGLGKFAEAFESFNKALGINPDYAKAHNNNCNLLRKMGRFEEAVASGHAALALRPEYAEAYSNLGNALQELGKLDDAVTSFRKALEINPGYAEAYSNLGNALQKQGEFEDAVASYNKALEIKPDYAEAHNNICNLLRELGRFNEAVASGHAALAINPDYAEAYINLGNALQGLGNLDDAIANYHKAIEIKPDNVEAHSNLGNALQERGDMDAAVASYHKALDIKPNYAEAYSNLGNALQELGKLDEAIASYHKALEVNPDNAEADTNLGNVLQELGKLDEAIVCYDKAIRVKPDYALAYLNKSLALLVRGEFGNGWELYDWRWKLDGMPSRHEIDKPSWNGKKSLKGRRLLILAEQGVGDEILFSSMYNDCFEAGAELIIECDERLIPLYERSFPACQCIPRLSDRDSVEAFSSGIDFHIFSGNLARVLRPDLQSFPKCSPFLFADEGQRNTLRKRYKGDSDDVLVGIAWESKNVKSALNKSVPLDNWHSILNVPGVKFVNIQYGDTAEQCSELKAQTGVSVLHDPEIDPLENLDAAAAQIAALDLVISSSNTAVHLSGALGVPTWVMLPVNPLWYWMLDREDSPWYASAKLFRQAAQRQWGDVTQRVAKELSDFVANSDRD